MAGNDVLLLGDLSNLAFRYAASHSQLTYGDTFTGGLYGFLIGLTKLVNEQKVTRFILCVDSPPYHRQAKYPAYKGDRGSGHDEVLLDQVRVTKALIRKWCERFNILVAELPGYEADDWIAYTALKQFRFYKRMIAWSNDSDLYQLFTLKNFSLYRGKKGLYSYDDFVKEFGDLTRDELRLMLAMVGTHNAVEGIRGIGEVTAKKILRDPVKLRQVRAEHGDLIQRNLELIELPYASIYADAVGIKHPALSMRFTARDMLEFHTEYGITLTNPMVDAWERLALGDLSAK